MSESKLMRVPSLKGPLAAVNPSLQQPYFEVTQLALRFLQILGFLLVGVIIVPSGPMVENASGGWWHCLDFTEIYC
jgi:hypothetical protein